MTVRRRERGAVLVVVAVAMVALLILVALVVDMGALRSTRRSARSAADAGATAGAVALGEDALTACQDALAYTFRNLDGSEPSAATVTSACIAAGMGGTCTAGTPRTARVEIPSSGPASDRTIVEVTNPVPDTNSLMRADAVGGGATQTLNASTDGVACDRLAVQVTRPQARTFGTIVSNSAAPFVIHSVARYSPTAFRGPVPPALVALNPTTCNAINAGNNGSIIIRATLAGPGIAYSDSDGTATTTSGTTVGCSSGGRILNSFNSGRLVAENSGANIGQLGWFSASTLRGYGNSASLASTGTEATATANYVGQMVSRLTRTTRAPVDTVYHCRNAPVTPTAPRCAEANDPVQRMIDLAALSTAPPGFSTYSGPCDSTAGATIGVANEDVFVPCPVFQVRGGRLNIPGGGTIIFAGRLSVAAGGLLAVNVGDPYSVAPVTGYPVPTSTTRQTTVIVSSTAADAIDIQSTSADIAMAQTTVFNRGGLVMQGSPILRWTSPSTGLARGLLYWSESTMPLSLGGGPRISANGVFFNGRGILTANGSGVIDLTNVQLWVDRAEIATGTPTVRLAPDPENSVRIFSGGSVLIR